MSLNHQPPHLIFDFNKVILFPIRSFPAELIVRATAGAIAGEEQLENSLPRSFNFLDYFEFNDELIKALTSLKKQQKAQIHLFTNSSYSIKAHQSKETLAKFCDQIFLAKDLGKAKDQSASYLYLAEQLSTAPEQLFFTDDTLTNVEAAAHAGLTTHHYLDNRGLLESIESFLSQREANQPQVS